MTKEEISIFIRFLKEINTYSFYLHDTQRYHPTQQTLRILSYKSTSPYDAIYKTIDVYNRSNKIFWIPIQSLWSKYFDSYENMRTLQHFKANTIYSIGKSYVRVNEIKITSIKGNYRYNDKILQFPSFNVKYDIISSSLKTTHYDRTFATPYEYIGCGSTSWDSLKKNGKEMSNNEIKELTQTMIETYLAKINTAFALSTVEN